MQVFQRGVNESLVIGQDVVITVLDIQPHCVRIAVQDPEASPAYYEQTLFFDDGNDKGFSEEAESFSFQKEDAFCFEEEPELTGSHLSSW